MLSFTPAQLAMYRALNEVMETNRQYLESQAPENWEDEFVHAPEWIDVLDLVKQTRFNWAIKLQQQHIHSLIQL